MLHGERPTIEGDGLQSQNFTCVANVVATNLRAAKAPAIAGRVFNVACGAQHTILDLVAALNNIFGTALEPQFTAPRPGDVRHSLPSIEQARAAMDYLPLVDFADGLRHTADWYRDHLSAA